MTQTDRTEAKQLDLLQWIARQHELTIRQQALLTMAKCPWYDDSQRAIILLQLSCIDESEL